ncbi:helix-turn-helix domain-containing protein [Streptomyces sp. ET3-23]|uniref:nSTAND1 domain-containing NTPase n=1 Tax=Streptomyces sp. ET3-23 TaxID=2885643 RepID=UPI001D0FD33A|nr:helix-turn-helix domain-containing protein [Streptomyces sp. ET3-23]MCC2279368.1 helix-turn-helix domain-containing protein [Streptomyces sp. ET3-23]
MDDGGELLRRLRRERGVSLAKLSTLAFYSKGYLSKVENGDKPMTLELARACDRALGTGGSLEELVRNSGGCPYRGLSAFGPQDARWFFGREQATAALVAQLTKRLDGSGPLMVVAPSGAGKSSLLRAGLIPALTRGVLPAPGAAGHWQPLLLTPGEHPAATLRALLDRATEAHPADSPRFALVVDQFEELFTLCQDESERRAFVELLHALTSAPAGANSEGPACLAVLGIRADFYGHCLAHQELVAALRHGHVPLGPMDTGQLREAITGPAEKAGLSVEPGLVELMLRDAGGTATPRAGVLPLLSHALLATWQQRTDTTLTVAGYQLTGGISGAVATTAEHAYSALPPEQQPVARRLLLHLVHLDDTGVTGRRMERGRLLERDPAPDAASAVLDAFARARLLTLDADHVELAHEALLLAWPRLHTWLDEDRAGLRIRQSLVEAAEAWEREERDTGQLYRGTRLALAREWAADPACRAALGPVAQAFLDAGIDHETAERRRDRRRTRRLRQLLASLAMLLALALVATGVAFQQREAALTAQREAQSRQLAAQSSALIDSDPDLASLLAVQAHRTSPTSEAVSSLYAAAALPLRHLLPYRGVPVMSAVFSRDGKTLIASGGDGTVQLRDVTTGTTRNLLAGNRSSRVPVALGADGRTVAASNDDGTVRLADVATGTIRNIPTGHSSSVTSVAFGPDGKTVATGSSDKTVRLCDVTTGTHCTVFSGHTGTVISVAFSPDGRTLATSGGDRTVRLWDVTTGTTRNVLTGHSGNVASVAFSPDGTILATGGDDATARLWDTATGAARSILTGHADPVASVAFSPDGRTLATAGGDRTVQLWDVATGTNRGTFKGHAAPVTSVAFSPDGRTLASASYDGTLRLWYSTASTTRNVLTGHTSTVASMAFSPDGTALATGSYDSTVRLWNLATGTPRSILTGHTSGVTAVAFSPDGRTLATGGVDKSVRLWDATTGAARVALTGQTTPVVSAAFSPDGRTLAVGGNDSTVRLWDVATGAALDTLTGQAGPVVLMAFSPEARTLATSSGGTTVQLWDVTTGKRRKVLTGHTTLVTSMAFSPDGTTLATGSSDHGSFTSGTGDDTVRLWDVATGKARNVLTGHTNTVTSLAFSPDGKSLASGSSDRTVRLWDAATGKSRNILTGHTGPVASVAYGPDGTTLATGSSDGTARIWNVYLPDEAEAVRRICTALHRDFTEAERATYLRGQARGVGVCANPR